MKNNRGQCYYCGDTYEIAQTIDHMQKWRDMNPRAMSDEGVHICEDCQAGLIGNLMDSPLVGGVCFADQGKIIILSPRRSMQTSLTEMMDEVANGGQYHHPIASLCNI